jgi:predicted transglutaminase-like cysteine proteinase
MKHTFFCLKYPDECKVDKIVFRGGLVRLTAQRWAELVRVNTAVNRRITPQPNTRGLAGEKWLISPKSGECHDYAVTKRHELHALGWPERDLLLSEVVTTWGEHHLVLVIRTSDGDFVADNLDPNIRRWSTTPYQWVRIQSPGNPSIWSTVASTTVWAKGSGLANREL